VWINELTGYKIRWAVDNYNDEYFSIKELEDFGFNIVKTSRKLFLDAMTDPVYKGIIELIVAESDKRNITLVAQGVETESQINFVKEVGFKYAQGYYFYKPLKTEELIAAIQKAKEAEVVVKGAKKKDLKEKVVEKAPVGKKKFFKRKDKKDEKVENVQQDKVKGEKKKDEETKA